MEREERDRETKERYLKWVIVVDRRTPGYIIREKLQREKLRKKAGIRALRYDERLREVKGNKLARRCEEEIRKRTDKRIIEERGRKRDISQEQRDTE